MPKLTAPQRKQLHTALVHAFASWDEIDEATQLYLDVPLSHIAAPAPLPAVVLKLIAWGEARGILGRVVEAARDARPDNPDLAEAARGMASAGASSLSSPAVTSAFEPVLRQVEFSSAAELHARPTPAPSPQRSAAREALQRQVFEAVLFFGAAEWRERMAAREATVCRVEFPAERGQGTGFLVAPDLVVTNHHVLAEFVDLGRDPHEICCRFDFHAGAGGVGASAGRAVGLAESWLVRHSPTDALDYAIVRLAVPIGSEPAGAAGERRGWLAPQARALSAGESIFVLQHPRAAPLKVASGGLVKAEDRRIWYLANTLNGSSGSPCFSANWELVGLHRAGDDLANVGVPFGAILADVPAADRAAVFAGGGL